jgi:type II secretory pathway predicted ATPase ExeA
MDRVPLGLKFRPFATGPDPAAYYAAPDHDEALNRLADALADGEPYAVLTAEPGLGKTLVAHLVVKRLGDLAVAFVPGCPFERPADLLQAILYDFGLPYAGRPEQELRLALTDYVLKNHLEGRRTLVVLDEAQSLSPGLLEEVRLLGNLETPHGRAVQVLLVGQPELLDKLTRPELAVLAHRLAVRVHLEPFGLRDAAEYIAFQVERAGGEPDAVMTGEAIEEIARRTGGVPRLINRAAATTLAVAAAAGVAPADAEAAMEALDGLGLAPPEESSEPPTFEPVLADDEPAELPWHQPQRFVFAPTS